MVNNNSVEYISIKNIINDYIVKSSHTGNLDVEIVTILADEAINQIITADNYKEYIVLLNLYNQKAKLPSNFKYPTQVAYRPPYLEDYTHSNDLKRYFVKTLESKLYETTEITYDFCESCKQEKCVCEKQEWYPIQVGENYITLSKTPQLATGYSIFMYGIQNPQVNNKYNFLSEITHLDLKSNNVKKILKTKYSSCFSKSAKCPEFQIVRPASNYFFNLPNEIKACNLPAYDTNLEYRISNGVITINNYDYRCNICKGCKSNSNCYFNYPMESHGEVLISYLGKIIDEEGFMMIPNDSYIIKAVVDYIKAGMAEIEYAKYKTRDTQNYFLTMKQISEVSLVRARSYFRIPDYNNWTNFMSNIYNKKIRYYDDDINLNRYAPAYYASLYGVPNNEDDYRAISNLFYRL